VLLTEAQQRNDVLSQAYGALQSEYLRLKSDQSTAAAQNQMLDLSFDPTIIGSAEGVDMDLYLSSNDTTGYAAYDQQQQYPR
jgi:AP-1-like transcription factor